MRFNLYRAFNLNDKNSRYLDSIAWINTKASIPIFLEEHCDYYPELDVWMTKSTSTDNVIIAAPETSPYFNLMFLKLRYAGSIPSWISVRGDDSDIACHNIIRNTWKTFYRHRHANEN